MRGVENSETDKKTLTDNEMHFFRRITGYTTIDKKRNADILRELHAVPLLDYLENYRHSFITYLQRMDRYRIPRQA